MRRAFRPALLLLAAPLLAQAPLAQETPPSQLAASLRTEGGSAWTGATLHLFHRPGVDELRIGEDWHATLAPDRAGRVRETLQVPGAFSAWALEELGDGTYRASPLLEGQRGDAPMQLTAGGVRRALRVRFDQLEAWAREAPFRIEQHLASGRAHVFALPADRELSLRPFPGETCTVRLLGRTGRVLLAHAVQRTEAKDGRIDFAVEAPRYLRVAVTGHDGNPVTNAVFATGDGFSMLGPAWSVISAESKEGVYDLRIPIPDIRYGRSAVRISAPGHGSHERTSAWRQLPTHPLGAAQNAHLRVTLPVAVSVRGRVMLDAQTPAAGMALLALDRTAQASQFVRTDAEGRFSLEELPPRRPLRLALWLEPEQRRLPKTDVLVEPLVFLGLHAGAQEDKDLGELRIDRLVRLSVQLVGPDGRPARHARVACGENAKHGGIYRPLLYTADRRGELELLVPELEVFDLAASSEGALAGAEIRTQDPGPKRLVQVEIPMPRNLSIRGTVKDKKGAPLPGALVTANPLNSVNSPAARFIYSLRTNQSRTDENGHFAIVVPSPDLRYHLSAQYQDGPRWVAAPPTFVDVEKKDVEAIEIEVPVALEPSKDAGQSK